MSTIKKILKPAIQRFYQHKAKTKLSELRNINSQNTNKIADSIYATLKNNLNHDEKKWIDKIEQKRKSLNVSKDPVLISDFGAGDANDTRTNNEMNSGVLIKKTIGEVCQTASKPYFWSLLLFKLIREFKPEISIELGTCLGISGAYQAAAMTLNGKGKLVSLEGAESLATLSVEHFRQLGLDNTSVVQGKFQDILTSVLEKNHPVDFAFIDGHHDEQATISYFEQFIPYLSDKSIIVFDDISWSNGMRQAWEKIENNKNVKIALDLRAIGICMFDKDLKNKHKFRITMY